METSASDLIIPNNVKEDIAREIALEEESASRKSGYLAPTEAGKPSLTSYIDPGDVQEAKELIKKMLGFEPMRACGYYMLVAIYLRPTDLKPLTHDDGTPILDERGKPLHLVLPESSVSVDQYRKNVALVLDQGPECYKHPKFEKTGPLCRIGEWIVIPRNEGVQFKYRGVPVQLIPDDRCLGVVSDPSYIEEA